VYLCTLYTHALLLVLVYHTCAGWIDASNELGECRLVFCRLVQSNASEAEQISFTLRIQDDFSWSVLFYQQPIEVSSCQLLGAFPENLQSADQVSQVVQVLEASTVCEGNPDEKFALVSSSRKDIFRDQTGMLKVFFCFRYMAVCACIFYVLSLSTHFLFLW